MIAGSVEPKALIVENTKTSPEFSSHPAAAAFPNIGSYLGVPVVLSDGTFYGTLCAVDPESADIGERQVNMLTVLARIVATALDRDRELSQREHAEQALRHQLEYISAITSSLDTGLYAVDQRGHVTFLNPAAASALGWSATELLGKDIHKTIHRCHAHDTPFTEEDCPLLEVLRSGAPISIDDDVFTRKDGTGFSVAYKAQPIFDDGQVTGAVVSFKDITGRKQNEEMRSFLASIVESSDDAIIGKTLEGVVTSWNSGAQRMYGYSSEEVVGKPITVLVPPEYPDQVSNILETIRRRQAVTNFETTRVKKDGSRIYVSLNISPVLGSRGEIIGASSIARDITERKRIEEALRESEQLFRSSFEDAAIGMALIEIDGRWLQVNKALCETLGYSEQELLRLTFQDITYPDDLERDVDYVRRLLAGESDTYQIEKRYLHKDGHAVWVLLNVSLMRDRSGIPLYFIGQIQDITERKELDEMKDRFVSSVSHELRTPLTSIEGYLDALLEDEAGPLNEEQREYAGIAYRNAERLKVLVEDLLLLSRIESGNLAMRFEAVDIGESLQHVEQELRTMAESKGVSLSVSAEPDLIVSGDQLRLAQVLSNLVSNAIKFTSSGRSVKLRACRLGEEVTVKVADQGVGIPEVELPRLTERFFRASTAGTVQGTGLGLAITKEIVQRHQGRLEIESEEGVGSTFRVVLPSAT